MNKANPLIILLIFLGVLALISVVDGAFVTVYSILTGLPPKEAMSRVFWPLTVFNEVVLLIFALIFSRILLSQPFNFSITFKTALVGVVFGLTGFFLASITSSILCSLVDFKIPEWYVKAITPKSPLELGVALLVIWGLVGFCEEIFFRGLIQGYFSQWKGAKFSILASSTFFAVAHLTPELWVKAVPAFVVGLLYGFLYEKTKSVTPPALAHAINDSMAILMLRWFSW